MSKNINVLDPHVANLIAAGEVVERPASAVKELIENSVDAGATTITIEIQRGGMSLIRVTDNGGGMSAENAKKAFLRHATSKISTEKDLSHLTTLGFRGEALAAITAVSKTELLTREKESVSGTALTLHGGSLISETETGCPTGTTIIIRELFFNTPARLKFVKRDITEAGHVQDAVVRAAMSHPEISFRLIKDGTSALHTPGDSQLKSCLYSALGREVAFSMLEVSHKTLNVTVSGFISRPEEARTTRALQYFFVNGRPVRCRTLTAALEEPYKNMIPSGKYPICSLHIDLPSHECDVNVHPAKTEVKFANEKAVFDAVYFAIKSAFSQHRERPELVLSAQPVSPQEKPPTASAQYENTHENAQPQSRTQYAPYLSGFDTSSSYPTFTPNEKPAVSALSFTLPQPEVRAEQIVLPVREAAREFRISDYSMGKKVQEFSQEVSTASKVFATAPQVTSQTVPETATQTTPATTLTAPVTVTDTPNWRYIGSALGGFLLCETHDTLWLIDKHAAHERIIFDRLQASVASPMSQMLMVPMNVVLPASKASVLMTHDRLLGDMGFVIEDFGGSLLVRATPDFLDASDISSLLMELAEKLEQPHKGTLSLRDDTLHTVACKAAVKLSQKTSLEDSLSLIDAVMSNHELRHCPHGRPVAIRLTRSQLERQFLR